MYKKNPFRLISNIIRDFWVQRNIMRIQLRGKKHKARSDIKILWNTKWNLKKKYSVRVISSYFSSNKNDILKLLKWNLHEYLSWIKLLLICIRSYSMLLISFGWKWAQMSHKLKACNLHLLQLLDTIHYVFMNNNECIDFNYNSLIFTVINCSSLKLLVDLSTCRHFLGALLL